MSRRSLCIVELIGPLNTIKASYICWGMSRRALRFAVKKEVTPRAKAVNQDWAALHLTKRGVIMVVALGCYWVEAALSREKAGPLKDGVQRSTTPV